MGTVSEAKPESPPPFSQPSQLQAIRLTSQKMLTHPSGLSWKTRQSGGPLATAKSPAHSTHKNPHMPDVVLQSTKTVPSSSLQ